MPIRFLGRFLLKWKLKTDRKMVNGIYLGAPPKFLDQNDLLCGDVLFCGDTSDQKKGKIIRTASAGNYVHCALYVGNGEVIDIVAEGVRSLNFDNFLEKYSYIAVTRCPGNEQFAARRKKIAEFAAKAKGGSVKGYSNLKAALSPFKEVWDLICLHNLWRRKIKPGSNKRAPKRMFCSEFIVEAYIDCEYIPRDYRYLQAARRTPNGLAEDGVFQLIGYVSSNGWKGISPEDHYLGGCGWVLTKEGRKRLKKREREMLDHIKRTASRMRNSKTNR